MASRKRIPAIKLPNHDGETAFVVLGENILFVTIDSDSDSANPCKDFDGVGSIRSLSKKHIDNIGRDEALGLLKSDPDVIPLSYYEHGRSLWMTTAMATGFSRHAAVDFRWDGVKFAGVWIPDDSVRESYSGQDGLSRREWMVKQADSACETYTQFCNGDVHGYIISAYRVRKDDEGNPFDSKSDYRRDTKVFEDSCWGFYGWEDVKNETIDQLRYALKKLNYSRRSITEATKEL